MKYTEDEFDYARYLTRKMHPDLFEDVPVSRAEKEFQEREDFCDGFEMLAKLFIDRHNGLPLLDTYVGNISICVTEYKPFNMETMLSEIDVEATTKVLKGVVQSARKLKLPVEKKYDNSYFHIIVTLSPRVKIDFFSSRETVCTRKVVGTKVIPEQVVEEVEWDCEKVSFLV